MQWWGLLNSPAIINEFFSLELLWAWEPTGKDLGDLV